MLNVPQSRFSSNSFSRTISTQQAKVLISQRMGPTIIRIITSALLFTVISPFHSDTSIFTYGSGRQVFADIIRHNSLIIPYWCVLHYIYFENFRHPCHVTRVAIQVANTALHWSHNNMLSTGQKGTAFPQVISKNRRRIPRIRKQLLP